MSSGNAKRSLVGHGQVSMCYSKRMAAVEAEFHFVAFQTPVSNKRNSCRLKISRRTVLTSKVQIENGCGGSQLSRAVIPHLFLFKFKSLKYNWPNVPRSLKINVLTRWGSVNIFYFNRDYQQKCVFWYNLVETLMWHDEFVCKKILYWQSILRVQLIEYFHMSKKNMQIHIVIVCTYNVYYRTYTSY